MKKVVYALPGNEEVARRLTRHLKALAGKMICRRFPDGETYVRATGNVRGKEIILVCTLHEPDDKMMSLYFLASELRARKAKKITLVAPYLAYMRQDKKFHPGEAVTSGYFASFVSSIIDELITIDPHLHRIGSLSEIYSIPTRVLHASQAIAKYIQSNIKKPVLIGPDSESKQWVSEIAKSSGTPYLVFQKKRSGDRKVRITVPGIQKFSEHTPVLVDDIISTARTMIVTLQHLKKAGMKAPVCVGVHAVFAGKSYQELKKAGASGIFTCNTIIHSSNQIDIVSLIAENLERK